MVAAVVVVVQSSLWFHLKPIHRVWLIVISLLLCTTTITGAVCNSFSAQLSPLRALAACAVVQELQSAACYSFAHTDSLDISLITFP